MTSTIFDGSTVWNRSVMLAYILTGSASVVTIAAISAAGVL